MNGIKFQLKTALWRAITSIISAVSIAGALALPAVAAPIAVKYLAPIVTPTAAVPKFACRNRVVAQFAESTPIPNKCPEDRRFLSADAAMEIWSAEKNGTRPPVDYPNPLLTSRINVNKKDFLSDLDKVVLTGLDIDAFDVPYSDTFLNLYHHGI